MKQQTFADIEYSNRRRTTKKELFLQQMNEIIPWDHWVKIIEPYYPTGKRGRPPVGIETMLRMYLLQIWFNLSDEGVEDEIYDSRAMKDFMGINFLEQQVPDATTLLKFRHLLEKHEIGKQIFDDIATTLDERGLIMHGGTIVDATIISAPSSTKNEKGERDPEMHQTKKGNEWHFGMKIHAGVDAGTGYIHTITGTSANVHDISEAHKLLREDDTVMYGDSGYTGIEKREEIANDPHYASMDFRVNKKPGKLRTSKDCPGKNWDKEIEHAKSAVRCSVEHPFLIVKNTFGYSKVVYKGIQKNLNRFHMLFACANLLMCSRAGRTKVFCGLVPA